MSVHFFCRIGFCNKSYKQLAGFTKHAATEVPFGKSGPRPLKVICNFWNPVHAPRSKLNDGEACENEELDEEEIGVQEWLKKVDRVEKERLLNAHRMEAVSASLNCAQLKTKELKVKLAKRKDHSEYTSLGQQQPPSKKPASDNSQDTQRTVQTGHLDTTVHARVQTQAATLVSRQPVSQRKLDSDEPQGCKKALKQEQEHRVDLLQGQDQDINADQERYGMQLRHLKDEVEKYRQELDAKKAEVEVLKKESDDLGDELKSCKKALDTEGKSVTVLKAEKMEELNKLDSVKKIFEAQLRSLTQSGEKQVAKLNAKLNFQVETHCAQVAELNAKLNFQVKTHCAQLKSVEKSKAELEARLRSLTQSGEKKVAELNAMLNFQVETHRAQLKSVNAELEEMLSKSSSTIEKLEGKLTEHFNCVRNLGIKLISSFNEESEPKTKFESMRDYIEYLEKILGKRNALVSNLGMKLMALAGEL